MTSPSSSLTLASASNRETRWVFVIILNILSSTIYSLTLKKHDAMTEVKDVFFYRRFSLTLDIVQQIFFLNPEKGGCGGRYRFIQ